MKNPLDKAIQKNEITNSIKNTMEHRSRSIMYGTFIITWLIWNWESLYITFFIDQDIIYESYKQLKISYLMEQYYFEWSSISMLVVFGKLFIGPLLSTYIIIWWISKIDLICNKKHLEYEFEKKNQLIEKQQLFYEKETSLLASEKEKITREKEIKKEELSQEELWDKREKEIKNNKLYKTSMNNLKQCLYEHRGRTIVYANDREDPIFMIPWEQLAFLDTNGLIEFTNNDKEQINPTAKGKYLLKKIS